MPDAAAQATVDVTAELTALADVADGEAAAGAVEAVPGSVLVAAGVGGACAAAPLAEAAWDVVAAVEAARDVAEAAAEAAWDAAEAADEADDVPAGDGEVAASACRENISKMTKIPAAAIATCTARRAM